MKIFFTALLASFFITRFILYIYKHLLFSIAIIKYTWIMRCKMRSDTGRAEMLQILDHMKGLKKDIRFW